VLTNFYGVSATSVPIYGLAFSVGNLIGPLVLGPLFDTVGRRPMISGTYLLSAALLAVSAFLFDNGSLDAASQTVMWVVIFFFASAGASAAYLTVSETWPIEIRSAAIAVFFAIGCIAGAIGPAFYGALIGDGSSRTGLFVGYLVGAAIMALGGIIELILGIDAEGKSLEDVTKPLTAAPETTTPPAVAPVPAGG
jgi:MFS family permease